MKIQETELKLKEIIPESVFRSEPQSAGIAWSAQIPVARLREAASLFNGAGFYLETITGLDFEDTLELVYYFNYYEPKSRVALRILLPHSQSVDTVSDIFKAATWLEREVHEFFGTGFEENSDLRNLFLPEDAEIHPLRKTFGTIKAYRKREEIYG